MNTTGAGGAYTSIQEAINDSKNGDTVFVYEGIYNENLIVDKIVNLIAENKETTIIDGSRNGDVVKVVEDWVNITGFTITNGSWGSDHSGVNLNYVKYCRVYNNNISKNGVSIKVRYSSDNEICENILDSTLDRDIEISSGTNNTIRDNEMGYGGILIKGGCLEDWNTHSIDSSNTINGRPVIFWKNKVDGTVPWGAGQVILANCTNIKVENQYMCFGYVGIQLAYSSYNTIVGNNLSYNNLYGIYLYSSHGNIISNNYLQRNHHGIYLVYSDNNQIFNNTLYKNFFYGIRLVSSCGNDIVNNTATFQLGEGIRLNPYSSNNNIVENILTDNSYGIYLLGDNINNTIIGNELSKNEFGVYLETSSYIYIIFNNISLNTEYGVYLKSSDNISIYHNTFINNTNQTFDDSEDNNKWDNGYPSGGNYWSDYNGNDDFHGQDQDRSGSDGIGDTPYVIGLESNDNYPILVEYANAVPPQIQLLLPLNNSLVKSGVKLDFRIYDEDVYTDNYYSINGGPWEILHYSHYIFTDGWPDGSYQIQIKSIDYWGNLNSSEFFFAFDSTSPYVSSTAPTNNTVDVALNKTITIVFSEHMNQSQTEKVIELSPFVNFTLQWNSNGTILYISFAENNLNKRTTYNLTIDSDLTDLAGNPLDSDFILVFTTVDLDSDSDGILDYDDSDDDDDGIPDEQDAFPLDDSEWKDTDNDGIGNNADPDDDNDGVPDEKDDFPLDPAKWKKASMDDFALYLLIIVLIIVVTSLILAMFFTRQKKEKRESPKNGLDRKEPEPPSQEEEKEKLPPPQILKPLPPPPPP